MKNIFKLMIQSTILIAIVFSLQACSGKFPVELKEVKQSTNSYNVNNKTKTVKEFSFQNSIIKSDKLITGVFKKSIHLQKSKKDIEGYSFIKHALINEFNARNLQLNEVDNSTNKINIEKFQIYTHRSHGFSPIVTFAMLKVTADIDGQVKTFSSIVKRAQNPAFFSDLFDPSFNEPIMIMVKEITSKINKEFFNYKLSDEKVFKIADSIKEGIITKDRLTYLNIYELGFSNNQKALDTLIAYSNNTDEYIRLSSISMLGLIGGESQFEYLVSKYKNSKMWQDRALSLKAISDIDTKKAKSFVNLQYNLWKNIDTKEGRWHTMLLETHK